MAEPQGSLYHEIDEADAEDYGTEGDGHMSLQLAAGGLVASEIAFDEPHIAPIGAAGYVQHIAHEEGDEADEDVP